jgi:tetratricopeptide (TPR) repeat protein
MNDGATNRTMPEKCPQCGALLPAGALAGLCPACLLRQGAAADTATRPEAKPFVPPTVEEVGRLFPQLEILGLLGKGGMGAVYKARQPALDRLVALKILPTQVGPDPGFAERFTREARALARLSHPNIVAVYEFGQVSPSSAGGTPALPYFVMEFVDGVNLRQLQKVGRLSPREALQIVPQICDALQYAHDEGIVHRDIKPENILVDRKGRVKIADFGLAKIVRGRAGSPLPAADSESEPGAQGTAHLTQAGQVMGTPHYMAPEQVEHPQAVDHRADIYSLGVVFYEMLTGELSLGRFQPPSRKVQVDVRLDDVVLHALEKEPERRYQQASQVKTDVETVTSSGPPKAGSLGAPTPMISAPDRRGGRRRKVALLTAFALALLLGLGVWLVALCLSATRGIVPPSGLVGWWRGERDGSDSAGTNNGVLQEGVAFVAGKVGQAFSFDGTNGYVEVPDAPSLRLTNELTIEFWVKRQDLQSEDYLINKGGDYTRGRLNYGLTINRPQYNSALAFTFAGGYRRSTSITDLDWHHVAVTARNGDENPNFYLDGVEQPITDRGWPRTISLYPSTEPLQIGAQVDPASGWRMYSKAILDEVSIYNRALAASEIQAIFAAGQRGKRGPNRGLLGDLLRNNWFPGNSRTGASRVTALPKGWSPSVAPGQKPDPNKVRDEGNALRAKGEYQAALDRYLWFWNHALEYEPAFSAVRLSFLLSDWVELGRRYPKAKQALLDTRARDTQLLLAGGGDFDLFMELSNINRSLQDEDATYEAFNKLRQRNPTLAWQCFLVAERLLIKHGDYALCLEYVGDPEAAFDHICQRWQLLKQHEQPAEENPVQPANAVAPLRPPTPPKRADRQFVDETCQLILILVKTEHKTEAEHIRDEALSLVIDPRLKSAVSDA